MAEQQAANETGTNETATNEAGRGLAKTEIGLVTSAKMDKTIVVAVTVRKKHKDYGKFVQRTKRYYAHDEKNECQVGDKVLIVESRPLSKLKRWRLRQVVEKAS